MAVDEKKLSMYLAGTLRIIFEGITDVVKYSGSNYTLVSYDGRDFVRDSVSQDGKLDERLLCKNIGKIVDCDAFMKDRLISEFEQNHVTFAAVEVVEKMNNGRNANRCYFVIDQHDKDKTDVILSNLNKTVTNKEMTPEAFLAFCKNKGISISGVTNVEAEVLNVMLRDKTLDFPFCTIKNSYGNYNLRIPENEEIATRDAIVKAVISCSARTRIGMAEQTQNRQREINDAIAKIMDSKKSYVVMDENSPNHYIRTDSGGFHNIIRTEAGEQELAYVERMEPHYATRAYNAIHDYSGLLVLSALDKDIDKQMEEARERAKIEKEPELSVKIEYYKRSFQEHIRETIEQDYLGRLQDNHIRFGNAVSHAVIEKDDTLKGDLESDRALNTRALEGIVKESSIDLSDLNGDSFKQQFCETVLGTRAIDDPLTKEAVEEEINLNSRLSELAEESPEIKMAVVNEIKQTITEVKEIDYEFAPVTREEFEHEIESKENAFLEIQSEEREV